MKLIDKFKNMFTEEVEIDFDEPVKKEVMQVEIPAPSRKKEEPKEEIPKEVESPKVEVPTVSKVEEKKEEEKFSFPVFFDDEDFKEMEKEEKTTPVREKKYNEKSYREAYRNEQKEKELYQGNSKVKSTYLKSEPKVFKPTPIISPIYGVLDRNYKKEDITTKDEVKIVKASKVNEITVDDIRKKAYGTLEDDLENNLLEYPEKEEKEVQDLFEEFEVKEYATREEKNKDITDLVEEELNHHTEDEGLVEDDLFNLINSMYEDEEQE